MVLAIQAFTELKRYFKMAEESACKGAYSWKIKAASGVQGNLLLSRKFVSLHRNSLWRDTGRIFVSLTLKS